MKSMKNRKQYFNIVSSTIILQNVCNEAENRLHFQQKIYNFMYTFKVSHAKQTVVTITVLVELQFRLATQIIALRYPCVINQSH